MYGQILIDETGGSLTGDTGGNLTADNYPYNWAYLSDYERQKYLEGEGYLWSTNFWSLTDPESTTNTDQEGLITYNVIDFVILLEPRSLYNSSIIYPAGTELVVTNIGSDSVHAIDPSYPRSTPITFENRSEGRWTWLPDNQENITWKYKYKDYTNDPNSGQFITTNAYFNRYYLSTSTDISGGDIFIEISIRYFLNIYEENQIQKASLIPVFPIGYDASYGTEISQKLPTVSVTDGTFSQRFTAGKKFYLLKNDTYLPPSYTLGRFAVADAYTFQSNPFRWSPVVNKNTWIDFRNPSERPQYPSVWSKGVYTTDTWMETEINESGQFVFNVDYKYRIDQEYRYFDGTLETLEYKPFNFDVKETFTFSFN